MLQTRMESAASCAMIWATRVAINVYERPGARMDRTTATKRFAACSEVRDPRRNELAIARTASSGIGGRGSPSPDGGPGGRLGGPDPGGGGGDGGFDGGAEDPSASRGKFREMGIAHSTSSLSIVCAKCCVKIDRPEHLTGAWSCRGPGLRSSESPVQLRPPRRDGRPPAPSGRRRVDSGWRRRGREQWRRIAEGERPIRDQLSTRAQALHRLGLECVEPLILLCAEGAPQNYRPVGACRRRRSCMPRRSRGASAREARSGPAWARPPWLHS